MFFSYTNLGDIMIFLNDNKVKVIEFKKIIKTNDKQIIFETKNKLIYIDGNNMYISFYEKDEFEIKGDINKIEFSNKS